MKPLRIAIDGPVGAGKSDISARLAKELGLVYLYTGAMYRVLALACYQENVAYKDVNRVLPLLSRYVIELAQPSESSQRPYMVLLNGEDVTELLFTPEIDKGASDVSTLLPVRRFMVKRQQEMAEGKRVVMDGRDIGLRVLPNAELKIYFTASLEERAKRRQLQYQQQGHPMTFEEVLADTQQRDLQDTTRSVDPLQKLPDAWGLDTTGKNQEEVVAAIKQELSRRGLL